MAQPLICHLALECQVYDCYGHPTEIRISLVQLDDAEPAVHYPLVNWWNITILYR